VVYIHNSCEKTRLKHSLFYFTNLRGRERRDHKLSDEEKKRRLEKEKVLRARGEIYLSLS